MSDHDPLPKEAEEFALLVAHGVPVSDAISRLALHPDHALAWVSHPDWRKLVKHSRDVKSTIDERMADMLEDALNVKQSILEDSDVGWGLKNSVATEVVEHCRGDHDVQRETLAFTSVEINVLKVALEEITGIKGDIVDVPNPDNHPDERHDGAES